MNKITLAITNYNRTDFLKRAFEQVTHDRIDEILIVDDCSDEKTRAYIKEHIEPMPKVKVYVNGKNIGMMANKAHAISLAKNDWVIIFDSDNIIDDSYIDAIPEELFDHVIYMPSFAKPNFNVEQFAGELMGRKKVADYIRNDRYNVAMNNCNYLVNKHFYKKAYRHTDKVKGSDTINHAINHLNAGGQFFIVPNMHYFHTDHAGSEFRKNMDENMRMSAELRKKIMNL